jgi:single-strand DNA-binding protein
MGNISQKPELKYTKSKSAVCKIYVAVEDYFSRDVSFFPVVIWGEKAKKYNKKFHKGDSVLIEGKLKRRRYEYNNEKRYITEIIASKIQLVSE